MSSINISCINCLVTNRISRERLNDAPICGKCKKPLFNNVVMELNASNVAATLNNNQIPVLVDCWAPWCGPCRNFAPIFSRAASVFEPNIRFAKLNTEEHQSIAARWNIRSIPTLLLFEGGKEQARISGALSMEQLRSWLHSNGVI